jgi:HTH-type transcriptional regulator, sugar sensing transcriptional regulator
LIINLIDNLRVFALYFEHMTTSIDTLTSLGLTTTEATLYLSGLQSPLLTIKDLSSRTKIKRPTVYHAIDTLSEKGLVSSKKGGRSTYFTMSPLDHLNGLITSARSKIDKDASTLEILISSLQQKHPASPTTTITHYHGIEEMKMVIDIALHCRSKKWSIIAPYKNFLREYDREYAEKYLRSRSFYNITSRTLWEFHTSGRELTPEEVREREPRFMPPSMQGKFTSMVILFDDKVALFSPLKERSVVLITSPEIHSLFSALFETIWEISETD